MGRLKIGDKFQHNFHKGIYKLKENKLIDPPHDTGKFEIDTDECRYTASTLKNFNKMGWKRLKKS